MKHDVSVVLVGVGMANTFVLSRLISALAPVVRVKSLSSKSIAPAIKLTLINADRHFASGIAYGRADTCFLLNTPIALIEPKREFRTWLEDNLLWIVNYIQAQSGKVGQIWLQKNLEQLQRGNYAEVSLPRLVYGLFLKAQLWQAYETIKQINQRYGANIQIEFLQATVDSIQRVDHGFHLSLAEDQAESVNLIEQDNGSYEWVAQRNLQIHSPLRADFISFGIGFLNTKHPHLIGKEGYFPSVYTPGMKAIEQAILNHPAAPVRIALLGTKAAALDVIYYIEHHSQLREKVKILAISASGQTRYPATLSDRPLPYCPTVLPQQLPRLQTSAAVVEAVKQEIAAGEAAGYTRLEVWRSLGAMGYVKMARQKLSALEKRQFDRTGQADLRKVTSFTDADSVEAFNHLKADGILHVLSGQIQSVQTQSVQVCPEQQHRFSIQIIQSSGVAVLNVDMVVNCMGPAPLTQNPDPLVACLINQQLVTLNESGMGVCVSGDRESSPNFFVVGPLTSGGEIVNRQGEPEFHLARHTMPYVLEDADAAGAAIGKRIAGLMQ